MKLLDCTFRDGGYYNDWDFEPGLVTDYLAAMDAARPDVIEIGFRFREASRYLGPFAYSPESVLKDLPLPAGIELAVMVNEADFPTGEEAIRQAVKEAFPLCRESRVDLVRIAANRERLENAGLLVTCLKQLGYKVGLNVMQIAGVSDEGLETISRIAAECAPDILYFADSTGSVRPGDIKRIVAGLRSAWQGPLGIHAHDNMQMALANCIAAAAEGVEWIDGTVTGMGRGPGNARTEHLVLEFQRERSSEIDVAPLLACIDRWFEPLRAIHEWGSNPYYFLSGKFGIHPTYIQTMLCDSRYGAEDILATIEYLRDKGASRYSQVNLEQAGNFYGSKPEGSWKPVQMIQGREVLILGSGPGCRNHRDAIERFIRRNKPVVIALNVNSPIDDELIDLRAACHPIRLLRDAPRYAKLGGTLVAPASVLPANVQRGLDQIKCNDYGLALNGDGFGFGAAHAMLPRPMAAAYSLAIANSGGATRIYMAGFDGYGPEDPRNLEMNQVLSAYHANGNAVEVTAITPTRYALAEDSVYRLLGPQSHDEPGSPIE